MSPIRRRAESGESRTVKTEELENRSPSGFPVRVNEQKVRPTPQESLVPGRLGGCSVGLKVGGPVPVRPDPEDPTRYPAFPGRHHVLRRFVQPRILLAGRYSERGWGNLTVELSSVIEF
jgi:hypothetical protein